MKFFKLALATALFTTAGMNLNAQTTLSADPMIAGKASPSEIPLEDFFRNPSKTSFQVSPDGRMISYLAPHENRMNLFVQPIDGGDPIMVTSVNDRDIAGYLWASNSRLLYLKDNGGDENFALYGVSPSGGETLPLTAFPGVRTEIIDDLENDDDHILVGLNQRDPAVFDVHKLNVVNGKLEMIAQNPGNISTWLADHDGNVRVATATDGVNTSLMYSPKAGVWEPVVTTNFQESIAPLFFSFDNNNIYCASNLSRDKSAIVLFDPSQARETKVIFEHPEVDVENLNYSRKRKVLTTVTYNVDRPERAFLDPETEAMFGFIQSQLPGYHCVVTDSDKEENIFIVRTYSDKSLGAYYIYNKAANTLTLIEKLSPWLQEELMADMMPVTFTSRDNVVIHGYLTMPKNGSKDLPVIINPHGGPWTRDTWGFNPEVQFLASRGYAVLQVNYRGSTGYGKRFWKLGFKEWGKKMQDDLADGVEYLKNKTIADPYRVGIYGGSYGGYATLAGLAFDPEIYACGVDYVGVSNLFTFMQTIPPYWKQYLDMMYEMVGHPEKDAKLLKEASPVMHADKIIAPLFIAQGAKDPRVNKAESDQMVEALRARGVTVQYMVEEEEGHGFHNEENRFEFYRAMEAFLAEHLQSEVAKRRKFNQGKVTK